MQFSHSFIRMRVQILWFIQTYFWFKAFSNFIFYHLKQVYKAIKPSLPVLQKIIRISKVTILVMATGPRLRHVAGNLIKHLQFLSWCWRLCLNKWSQYKITVVTETSVCILVKWRIEVSKLLLILVLRKIGYMEKNI